MANLDAASLASPSSTDHPLSPGSTPQGGRRASSAHAYSQNGTIKQDYFGSSSTTTRPSRRRTVVAGASSTGPSTLKPRQKLSPTPSGRSDVLGSFTGDKATPGALLQLDSLTKAEMAVVEERFDLMDDGEIESYLEEYGQYTPGDVLSTPRAARRAREAANTDSPLFPPSPPAEDQLVQPDHPLRILSRAVREMQEAVRRVQAENEKLQEELQRYRPAKAPHAVCSGSAVSSLLVNWLIYRCR